MTSLYPGTRLNLNISLSFIGRNGPAHLFCPGGIFFVGKYTEVTFEDLTFYSTAMSFYYGSATILRSVFTNTSEAEIKRASAGAKEGILKFHSMANLTILGSFFKGNAKIWFNRGNFISLMDSHFHDNDGMAATIFPSNQATIAVNNCTFINNWGGLQVSQIKRTSISVTNSLFSQNSRRCSLTLELDSSSAALIENITVENNTIPNTNQRKASVVYISLSAGGNNEVQIHNSYFKHNTNVKNGVGAIIIDNDPDLMTSTGCKTDVYNTSFDAFPAYSYTNRFIFRNSVFEQNNGQSAGAVLVLNGLAIFQNCSFVDNFAVFRAGHMTIGAGSGAAEIYNCTFRQAKRFPYSDKYPSFLYSSSSGPLVVKDTFMDFIPLSNRF